MISNQTPKKDWQLQQQDLLSKLTHDILQIAQEEGAEDVVVSGSCSLTDRVTIESGELSLACTTEETLISLTLIRDHQKATATLNTTDTDSLRQAIRKTLDLGKYTAKDNALCIAEPTLQPHNLPFLNQSSLLKLGLNDLLEASLKGQEQWHSPLFAADRLETSLETSVHALANSNGLQRHEAFTVADWGFAGFVRDQDSVSSIDYDGGFSHQSFADLSNHAQKFEKQVLSLQNPQPLSEPPQHVLLAPRAMDEIILEAALYHINGTTVRDQKNRWSIGEQAFSSQLHITENPHHSDFRDATSWDHDGLATMAQPLIQEGVIQQFIVDCHTARALQVEPKGLCGAPFGLKIHPGYDRFSDLITGQDVLLVERFSGHVDPLTGDFSGVAKNSYHIKKGEKKPVVETMISGNIFKALQNIQGMSQEVVRVSGSYEAPYMLFKDIEVS